MAELKPTTVTIVELTAKQYAAIHLCVPDSGNDELDAMIRRAQRERLAGQAMIKFSISDDVLLDYKPQYAAQFVADLAQIAYQLADALIAAEEVGK
jgi:hypothetical protein